ncbi:MAG: DEAD/DEAH box helicase [Spirochaetales bacterium]|nr:DEAD/DEAH box helicase [Spirochaetales bacterium]
MDEREIRIREQLAALDLEKQKLLSELNSVSEPKAQPSHGHTVRHDQSLSTEDKISLFLELFGVRTDVFPKLWENKNKTKKGYSPACRNEWVQGTCPKPKAKCADCPHRDYIPLDSGIAKAHLLGKMTIGVYAIRRDDTCIFLAADFDKNSWQKDLLIYKNAAARLGVPVYMERSRSGSGGHGWIFFDTPIQARKARQLGTVIMTQASLENPNVSLDSYDRFFPNQDYLPNGGFGNLIALPLQKAPGENGNSLFIDDDLQPFPSQWSLLSRILRLAEEDIDEILSKSSPHSAVPMAYPTEEAELQEAETGIDIDFERLQSCHVSEVTILLGAMINIDITALPHVLVLALKRTATFANPVFFKKQKMRFSTWDTPKYIFCGELVGNVLRLPRALFPRIKQAFHASGSALIIQDKRNSINKIEIEFTGELKAHQQPAVEALLKEDYSVLAAPTGSGKTIIAINVIARRKVPTLILVHRKELLTQWENQLHALTGIPLKAIGVIDGTRNKPLGTVDIAMLQTLAKKESLREYIPKYEQIVIDECHHIPAPSFDLVLSKLPVRYTLGLTATPYRKDGHHPILFMLAGPVRYAMSEDTETPFSRKVLFYETDFRIPQDLGEKPPIYKVWEALVKDKGRNSLIVSRILEALQNKRHILVLSERKDHLEELRASVGSGGDADPVLTLTGEMGKKKRRENLDRIRALAVQKAGYCIFSTGSLIGEGFDLPELDTLFLAMPVSFKGRIIQYAGRLHREYEGKEEIVIYDFVDGESGLAISMFNKRLGAYRKMNYEVIVKSGSKINRWVKKPTTP